MNKLFLLLLTFFLLNISFAASFDTLFGLSQEEANHAVFTWFNHDLDKKDTASSLNELEAFYQRTLEEENTSMQILAEGLTGIYYYYFIPGKADTALSLLRGAVQRSSEIAQMRLPGARFSNLLAYFLFRRMHYQEALELMLRSDYEMRQYGYENIKGIDIYLYNQAVVYFGFDQYHKAIDYLKESLKYNSQLESKQAAYNMLGLAYAELEDKQMALDYFLKSREAILARNDSSSLSTVNCNLGIFYLDLDKREEAIRLLSGTYHQGLEDQKWREAYTASIWLARIANQDKKLELAEKWLKIAEKIRDKKGICNMDGRIMLYEEAAKYYELSERYPEASLYKDSVLLMLDSLIMAKDLSAMLKLNVQLTTEKHQSEVQLLEQEHRHQAMIRNSIIIIAVLFIILLIGLWVSVQRKRQREKNEYRENQERSLAKLKEFRERIREKNELLESLRAPIEQVQAGNYQHVKAELVNKLSEQVILTEADWTEFKKLFEITHPNFLSKVQNEFPELTLAEIRFLVLLKLNLSVEEMANTLAILPQSVRKTRLRLMKKLSMSDQKDLRFFVKSI
jgi:DNA-binding CsgD family transcriptional regulator